MQQHGPNFSGKKTGTTSVSIDKDLAKPTVALYNDLAKKRAQSMSQLTAGHFKFFPCAIGWRQNGRKSQ